ncbi:MAG TPA: activase [Candidatus Anaerostipes avistercoris]|uniref:Activase n=1 Tax=Candidatus Anaerostipes avistercoris TaxID=2838462 RepID=A0A9D2PJ21_9FIRM|nr:activase [Candidatus Anaerostipes avistercoris]
MSNMNETKKVFLVGLDVGSTTTKIAAIDQESHEIQYSDYKRHHAAQKKSVYDALNLFKEKYPDALVRVALTGSGAKLLAEELGVPYIQEVVANSIALKDNYSDVRTAIELGGQDAKMIFFRKDSNTGDLTVADMRMNGSCAGGTGAFIDEIASLLRVPVEEFDDLASRGTCVYDISGRCGVYAKTDIQPLLNQGIAKEDIALSSLHAIAKQTIGGLAQGLDIEKPVAFEGGPMTFQPTLVKVFAERLNLSAEDMILPEHPEIMIAYGTALSIPQMFEQEARTLSIRQMCQRIEKELEKKEKDEHKEKPFFQSKEEKEAFLKRHARTEIPKRTFHPGEELSVYLGIDSGSTTTKFVLIDENENIVDSFYASNEGEPLLIAKKALLEMNEKYRRMGVKLNIKAAGTTGYGEMLFYHGFGADCHMVETVAHARATSKYVPDATFILDIGGQDMKAIWLDNGIITNIVVNEACSSGCGSFLENFASSLHIPVMEIADAAFDSENPAALGSRCTVFMNSSIVTEQRNGKGSKDIMAGLCRSIIENVFTKVIRISSTDSLGDKIVVQGGTFQNDAVLRALENYIGKEVVRAPYPGIMGAIGAALTAKEHALETAEESTFITMEELKDFSFTQEANVICPFCTNHCKRAVIRFSNGKSWVTNNRCERGEIIGDAKEKDVQIQLKKKNQEKNRIPNLYQLREKLLFQNYPTVEAAPDQHTVIGIPRVLSFWDMMPFWTTFFKSLGFQVKLSDKSSRKIYENGLSAVTSDTVCFPAKLVHGHIRNLKEKGVDRIFMPSITTMVPENQEKTSESMCAVVKGYPIVIRNSDDPERKWGIPFDAPLFHWQDPKDRDHQLAAFMEETFGITQKQSEEAMKAGDRAQQEFRSQLKEAGAKVLKEVEENGTYAVVLASRPYQNDALVNHDLPEMLTSLGIPVLTADSLPEAEKVDLKKSRLDIVNNYHARMLSSAIMAARNEHLEYIQIVSFGCGHDAYLSDEIQRVMKEISGKVPLILKLDESDIQGPLRIRVRSFIETVNMRKKRESAGTVHSLTDPYKVKFTKKDKKEKIVLIPNTSHAFSRLMSAALSGQGIRTVPLEIGREEAIRLGKKYVHNDICFPAQIVIGEALAPLVHGKYDDADVAVCMAKYVGDCRLTHYGALLRKALDDAGFAHVPILTNDDEDSHNLHPGFKMNLQSSVKVAFGLPMIDVLEELLRKIRPYELKPGSADKAFEEALGQVIYGMRDHGLRGAKKGFKKAIDIMNSIPYDRSEKRPGVLIVGEYLLNFHPGANHDIEKYLEQNGFEIIEARMTDVIRKTYFCRDAQIQEFDLKKPFVQKTWYHFANRAFDVAHAFTDRIAKRHPLYERACRLPELVKDSDSIIHHTFDAGEGVLIPGEILHHAKHGCRAFVILQPFGCLPNHVVGRGVVKRLKEIYPDAQILPLDYDPDVSFANVENRLQMLVMNMKSNKETAKAENVKEEESGANELQGKRRRTHGKYENTAEKCGTPVFK